MVSFIVNSGVDRNCVVQRQGMTGNHKSGKVTFGRNIQQLQLIVVGVGFQII